MHSITETTVTEDSLTKLVGARGAQDYTNEYSILVSLSVNNGKLTANAKKGGINAKPAITLKEVKTTNGVIHILDNVIDYSDLELPTLDVKDTSIMPSFFAAMLEASGITLPSDCTVFAPEDAAFMKISGITTAAQLTAWPTHVLQSLVQVSVVRGYHTAQNLTDLIAGAALILDPEESGEQLNLAMQTGDGANGVVINTNINIKSSANAKNGVVHILDQYIQPLGVEIPQKRLFDFGVLPSIFKSAVTQAGLESTIQSTNLTVLAPTDEAFQEIGVSSTEDLEKYSFESLQRIVRHALVRGSYGQRILFQEAIFDKVTLTSLDGETPIAVFLNESVPLFASNSINAREVSNLTATDGVLYKLNRVLLPPGVQELSQEEENTQDLTVLDLILIASIAVCVFLCGIYFLYSGSMTSYLKKRKQELNSQADSLRQEAMKDEKLKRAAGKDHGGFKSLKEIEEEDMKAKSMRESLKVDRDKTSSESSKQLTLEAPEEEISDNGDIPFIQPANGITVDTRKYRLPTNGSAGGLMKTGDGVMSRARAPPRSDPDFLVGSGDVELSVLGSTGGYGSGRTPHQMSLPAPTSFGRGSGRGGHRHSISSSRGGGGGGGGGGGAGAGSAVGSTMPLSPPTQQFSPPSRASISSARSPPSADVW